MQLDFSCVAELDGNLTSLTERQMEFDTETDPRFMSYLERMPILLLGESHHNLDVCTLTELLNNRGPVWVTFSNVVVLLKSGIRPRRRYRPPRIS